MSVSPSMQPPNVPHPSTGARLVSASGAPLPLLSAHLECHAGLGMARTTLSQTFRNPYSEPLEVTYSLPLPHDGAVAGFSFQIGDRVTHGEIHAKKEARQRFEAALAEGRTAALLEQERGSLFSQTVGNLPGGATLRCEVVVDQPLHWRVDGQWEWRFPTVAAPRYLGARPLEAGAPDGTDLTIDMAASGETTAKITARLSISDTLSGPPLSPSHSLQLHAETVEVADAALDRDLVVRWPVAAERPGLRLQTARPSASPGRYGLLTITPPRLTPEAMGPVPRDLCLLLDISGSMYGEPLAQARRVLRALIDSLTERDTLELVAFSYRPVRWQRRPAVCTPRQRADAIAWLDALEAGGGTEMKSGILKALKTVRPEAQRQIIVVTDGLIGDEAEIVGTLHRRLPAGSRCHTLGVGHAVNRSLTSPLARAGGGVELVCAPARMSSPLSDVCWRGPPRRWWLISRWAARRWRSARAATCRTSTRGSRPS